MFGDYSDLEPLEAGLEADLTSFSSFPGDHFAGYGFADPAYTPILGMPAPTATKDMAEQQEDMAEQQEILENLLLDDDCQDGTSVFSERTQATPYDYLDNFGGDFTPFPSTGVKRNRSTASELAFHGAAHAHENGSRFEGVKPASKILRVESIGPAAAQAIQRVEQLVPGTPEPQQLGSWIPPPRQCISPVSRHSYHAQPQQQRSLKRPPASGPTAGELKRSLSTDEEQQRAPAPVASASSQPAHQELRIPRTEIIKAMVRKNGGKCKEANCEMYVALFELIASDLDKLSTQRYRAWREIQDQFESKFPTPKARAFVKDLRQLVKKLLRERRTRQHQLAWDELRAACKLPERTKVDAAAMARARAELHPKLAAWLPAFPPNELNDFIDYVIKAAAKGTKTPAMLDLPKSVLAHIKKLHLSNEFRGRSDALHEEVLSKLFALADLQITLATICGCDSCKACWQGGIAAASSRASADDVRLKWTCVSSKTAAQLLRLHQTAADGLPSIEAIRGITRFEGANEADMPLIAEAIRVLHTPDHCTTCKAARSRYD